MKRWLISPSPPADFLNQHPELPPLVTRLLWNRGLRTQAEIDEYLNPDYLQDLHDPFLFRDMQKAVETIFLAIKKQKNIVVHGDYDADGVCAAVILVSALKKLGAEQVSVFLPHREIDGYGLNLNTVRLLAEQKTNLIITCDCGISNIEEITQAVHLGMQVIVTDHHTVPSQLPPASAIIHPLVPGEKYPDKGLAGGGVAFKLTQALLKHHQKENSALPDGQPHESFEKWLLDLAAIATVADMVPLLGESRTIARYGLTVLNKTRNPGLKQLLINAGLSDDNGRPKRGHYDALTIGFQIAPRLNAAGRMDHANAAYALLTASNDDEAQTLAKQLNQNNSDRQRLTDQIVKQARKQIIDSGQKNNNILFVLGENWPTGILGLIAGRIKEEYYRPTIALGLNQGEITGSGRSVAEFNLIAALQNISEFFTKFGGHPQACGLLLKSPNQLEAFKAALLNLADKQLAGIKLAPAINIDAEVDLEEVDWKLYDLLQKMEPFGQANEEPKYAALGLTVLNVEPVGQDGKHLRLAVKHRSHVVRKTIAFGFGDAEKHPANWRANLKTGDKIDAVFSVGVNEWNGNRELQLTLLDLRTHQRV